MDIVETVLSKDPLANRLGSAERRRRLIDNFSYARQRLSACFEERSHLPTTDEVALQSEALSFETQLNARVLEQDIIETGTELVDRIEQLVVQRCGVPTTTDRALVLIGRQHGAQTR